MTRQAREVAGRTLEIVIGDITVQQVSMSIYGYPMQAGARVALSTVSEELAGTSSVEMVRFVLREATWEAFTAALEDLLSA